MVSGGTYPAKAVVGEVVPVCATVWREGHEAVAATLVVRYHGRATRNSDRVPCAGRKYLSRTMPGGGRADQTDAVPHGPGPHPGRLPQPVHPDRVGLWTFRIDGWGDPVAGWHHAVTAKPRPARRGGPAQ